MAAQTAAPAPAGEAEALFSFPTAATVTTIGGGTRIAQGLTILIDHQPSTKRYVERQRFSPASVSYSILKRLDVGKVTYEFPQLSQMSSNDPHDAIPICIV